MTPKNTPWGPAQYTEELAHGIISISTASHGGIWLSEDRRMQIGQYDDNWLHTAEWWEEDCDWCVPYVWFQADIRKHGKAYKFEENLETARNFLKRFHPHFAARMAGMEVRA